MKKILSAAVVLTLVTSTGLCYGADSVKTTPQEYFKYAGTAADPSYQDYVATSSRSEKGKNNTNSGSYTAEREKTRERVKNSPRYTVPQINHKGTYGQAK
ncbi:MAG: hypothetical protein A4E61_00654 [Syntrophorhabdus sp. PtaB.Bin184]|nr:MAG: hypothetical protein A4E61_00654 [Syntrophorhabdus sp. PtaB.Bin184]